MAEIQAGGSQIHSRRGNENRANAPTPEEAVAAFREEYLRCGALTMEDYDRRRSKGAPGSATAIKRAGVDTWRELLDKAGLPGWQPSARKGIGAYKLSMHFLFQDELAEWDRKNGG